MEFLDIPAQGTHNHASLFRWYGTAGHERASVVMRSPWPSLLIHSLRDGVLADGLPPVGATLIPVPEASRRTDPFIFGNMRPAQVESGKPGKSYKESHEQSSAIHSISIPSGSLVVHSLLLLPPDTGSTVACGMMHFETTSFWHTLTPALSSA